MQIWPGQPYPLGATFDGVGHQLLGVLRGRPSASSCACSTTQGMETRVDLPEMTALCWHGYCRTSAGAALRLPRARPVGAGAGPLVQSRQAAARSLRQGDRRHVGLERSGVPVSLRRARDVAERSRQRAVHAQERRRSTRSSTGATIGGRTRRGTRRSSTRRTSRASPGRHPEIPEELRGTYAGLAHPVAIEYLQRLGVTAVELLPVHQFVQDSTLLEQGLRNYWGYNSIGYLAPHNEYARGQRGEQVQEFKQLVKTLHEAGIEVILDVVYNHTAEGNHLGPMLSFKGIDNAAYYRLMADNRRYYMDYTGTGNTLNMRHPHVLQLIMDSLRYWVHRDARRRLPLRPRGDARARAARRRPAVGVLRSHPAGSGRQPGQADRRAVGRRRRRLPGRQLPAAVVGVERQVPRHRARLLARHRSDAGGVRLPVHRQLRPLRGHGAQARTRASTSSPRTTASRCAIWSRTTRSTTRPTARTTATARATTARGTAAPRGRPTIPRSSRCAPASCATSSTTLLLSQGVPMLLGGDEIGRTQQRQQQRLLPGQRDLVVRLGRTPTQALLQFTRGLIRLRQRHPVFCRRRWFQGRPIHGTERQRHRLVHAGRRRDVGRGLAGRLRQVARRLPQRRRASRRRTSAASGSSTTAST